MKKILFSLLLTVFSAATVFGAELTIEGYFQGENIYVLNPFSNDGEGYCVTEITVNGQISEDQLNSSSFEIDLMDYDLKKGDPVNVVITHTDGCKPQILNIDALKPQSTFTITSINININGVLNWSTIEEQGKLPYTIEQYRWDKWVPVAQVMGQGLSSRNDYSFDLNEASVYKPHSGVNRYRLKQVDYRGKSRYSLETSYNPNIEPVEVTSGGSTSGEVTFSKATSFEVISKAGRTMRTGFAEKVDIGDFEDGKYYINFDVSTEKVKLK